MGTWALQDGVLELPCGRRVRGQGRRHPRPDVPGPEFTVHLLRRDPQVDGPRHAWIRWPQFGVPASTEDALTVLGAVHDRASTERVEIACRGGVGRTGTALALLVVLSGATPEAAAAWVRARYHPRAAENPLQREWLRAASASVSVSE